MFRTSPSLRHSLKIRYSSVDNSPNSTDVRRIDVVVAILVLPITICHPNIDKMSVFWTQIAFTGVKRQSDRLAIKFDLI